MGAADIEPPIYHFVNCLMLLITTSIAIIFTYTMYRNLYMSAHPYPYPPLKMTKKMTMWFYVCNVFFLLFLSIQEFANGLRPHNVYETRFGGIAYVFGTFTAFFYYAYLIQRMEFERLNNYYVAKSVNSKVLVFCQIVNILTAVLTLATIAFWVINPSLPAPTHPHGGDYPLHVDKAYIFYIGSTQIPWLAVVVPIISFGYFTMDSVLLTSYVRALHTYNKYLCRIDDNLEPNPLQHEQLIIITRFFVLFGLSVFCHLFWVSTFILLKYNIFSYEHFRYYGIVQCLEYFGVSVYLIVVMVATWCTYEFSYYQYRRICFCCHSIVYKICERITMYQYHKKWGGFLEKEKNIDWKTKIQQKNILIQTRKKVSIQRSLAHPLK